MKKLLLASLFLYNGFLLAQEPLTIKEIDSTSTEVPFSIIEKVPIYKGCDATLSNKELKDCMSNELTKHVVENFKTNIAKRLDLPDGIVKINVIFKINTEGNVIDILVKAPHPELEAETIRVISSIPKLDSPGHQDGEPVIVPYALPIVFKIDGSKKRKSKNKRN